MNFCEIAIHDLAHVEEILESNKFINDFDIQEG